MMRIDNTSILVTSSICLVTILILNTTHAYNHTVTRTSGEFLRDCDTDSDCKSDEVCRDFRCTSLLTLSPSCALNAIGVINNHNHTCECLPDYEGDADVKGCVKSKKVCNGDQNCEARNNGTCVIGCSSLGCGFNSMCYQYDHVARCECLQGYEGDAYGNGCIESKNACNSNQDCEDEKICDGNICIFGCNRLSCSSNTICHTVNHVPICECIKGYKGDAYHNGCYESKKVCHSSKDCEDDQMCRHNYCRSRCMGSPCPDNSECHIRNHVPTCECLPGYKNSTDDKGCVEFKKVCNSTQECEESEVCHSNICEFGCKRLSCGVNAICRVDNHVPKCQCIEGYEGDAALKGCVKSKKGCNNDQDCKDYEVCNNKICTSDCGLLGCGHDTTCFINNHNRTCECLSGYEGDADGKGCVKSKKDCNKNWHCNDDEVCNNQICTSECKELGCGRNTACYITNHIPICKCLPGYKENPFGKGCITSEKDLDSNDEVEDDKVFNNDTCTSAYECGFNTICDIKNLGDPCKCLPGYEGDPYSEGCIKFKNVCHTDEDCGDYEVHNSTTCTSKCKLLICGINTICDINDDIPICTCLPGYEGEAYGKGCVKSKKVCNKDQDCHKAEKCDGNICISVCKRPSCGINAICVANNHVATCECLWRFEGNAYRDGCVKSKKVGVDETDKAGNGDIYVSGWVLLVGMILIQMFM